MSENNEEQPAEESPLSFNFDFAPSWARTDPSAREVRETRGERPAFRRDERGDRPRGERPAFRRDDRPRGERPPREGRPAFRKDDRPRGDRREEGRRPQFREAPPPPLPLEVRVLPEQKALGLVIRRIQNTRRAFPVRDLANLFLDNPASVLLRAEARKGEEVPLFQCRLCGLPALTEEEIVAHLFSAHFNDFFEAETVACEPPSGNFVCIAKCGISGVLLGPPNHHGFNAKVAEMLRTRFAGMSEAAYRARIETVRDPEAIEQWKKENTTKTVWHRKGVGTPEEPAPALEREAAESIFRTEIVPAQLARAKHFVCTAAVGMKTPSRQLMYAFRDALRREDRFPLSITLALRGAFRHRSLTLFRANDAKGPEFVQLAKPAPLDAEHAVQILKDILAYVSEHPCCTSKDLFAAVGANEKPEELMGHLAWLVEKGHLIHYHDDQLCAPLQIPLHKRAQAPVTPAASAESGERKAESVTAESGERKAEGEPAESGEPKAEGGGLGQAALPAEQVPSEDLCEAGRARSPSAPQQPAESGGRKAEGVTAEGGEQKAEGETAEGEQA